MCPHAHTPLQAQLPSLCCRVRPGDWCIHRAHAPICMRLSCRPPPLWTASAASVGRWSGGAVVAERISPVFHDDSGLIGEELCVLFCVCAGSGHDAHVLLLDNSFLPCQLSTNFVTNTPTMLDWAPRQCGYCQRWQSIKADCVNGFSTCFCLKFCDDVVNVVFPVLCLFKL